MEQQTIEAGNNVAELLKPRFKVIADYPESKFKVGEIIQLTWNDPFPDKYGGYETFYNKYPHLFKKLEWWEDRKESEMPQYVAYKLLPDSKEKLIKVPEHFRNSFGEYNSKIFCIDQVPYCYSKCRIATEEEFNSQPK